MKTKWNHTVPKKYFDIRYDMNKCWWDLHRLNALALLTIYKWEGKINYEIYGNKTFKKPKKIMKECTSFNNSSFLRRLATQLVYWFLKPRKNINLQNLLACPLCKGNLEIKKDLTSAKCLRCNILFRQNRGFLDFRV